MSIPSRRLSFHRLHTSFALNFLVGSAVLVVAALVVAEAWGLGFVYVAKGLALYAAIAALAMAGARLHLPHQSFGAANRITLLRAIMVCLVGGLMGQTMAIPQPSWILSLGAATILCLDGLDGWMARRMRGSSRFGALFDQEVDALCILILSLLVFLVGKVGAWVVLSGVMRYAFLAAGLVWSPLRAELPPSWRRRLACGLQVVALVVCLAPVVDVAAAALIAITGLLVLAFSFANDTIWLIRSRR